LPPLCLWPQLDAAKAPHCRALILVFGHNWMLPC
jgi:hypothetical protein